MELIIPTKIVKSQFIPLFNLVLLVLVAANGISETTITI